VNGERIPQELHSLNHESSGIGTCIVDRSIELRVLTSERDPAKMRARIMIG
jgi:hypothetical protein